MATAGLDLCAVQSPGEGRDDDVSPEVELLRYENSRLTAQNAELMARLKSAGIETELPKPAMRKGCSREEEMVGKKSTMQEEPVGKKSTMRSQVSLVPTEIPVADEDISNGMSEQSNWSDSKVNWLVLKGSAMSRSRPVQALIYLVAFAGVAGVLYAQSTDSTDHGDEEHRRLGGDVSPILVHIAFSLLCVGILAIAINLLKQPLILGYLLGGVLVGPIGLNIVPSHEDISTLSSLGLVFLLFMVGLELDVKELLKMGKVVIFTGLLQFPICAGIHIGIFMALESAGLSFGTGDLAAVYCGLVCGISSTMIVVKLLSAKCDMDSQPGRLTIGILIFQDIWAITILAVQPKLDEPEVTGILKIFGKIAVLLVASLLYAKFVMPAVLYSASKNVELMLVLALAWCFFVCCAAVLSFVGLGMELASLIAGLALATFPYSAEFNGKIKYIRDFFITLFFVALGMQIPVPTFDAVAKGVLVAIVVLLVRWVGIWLTSRLLGAPAHLSTVATVNLSQISEFALVICSLGQGYGHIESDTLTIIIWTFAILAISSSYLINGNRAIAAFLLRAGRRCMCRPPDAAPEIHQGDEDHVERDIIFLGFHNIAAMILAHFRHHEENILPRVKVIHFDEEIMNALKSKGIECAYGDISSADVLEHCHHGEVRLVVCTIPDSLLQGVDNRTLLRTALDVWSDAKVVVTAESSRQAAMFYKMGASYVLRVEKLCGERLGTLIADHINQPFADAELSVFHTFIQKDKRTSSMHFNDAVK